VIEDSQLLFEAAADRLPTNDRYFRIDIVSRLPGGQEEARFVVLQVVDVIPCTQDGSMKNRRASPTKGEVGDDAKVAGGF
jgi:hypothetical protein